MAFRFQGRIKLFPGFRLSLSKSGVSVSAGIPGFTVNSRGTTTVGIPGTGLSYRHHHKNGSQDAQQPEEPQKVGYSSDEVNDMVRELRNQIIDKIYFGLWEQEVDAKNSCQRYMLRCHTSQSQAAA